MKDESAIGEADGQMTLPAVIEAHVEVSRPTKRTQRGSNNKLPVNKTVGGSTAVRAEAVRKIEQTESGELVNTPSLFDDSKRDSEPEISLPRAKCLVLSIPESLLLPKERPKLIKALRDNRFAFVFFEHLSMENLEKVIKQADLIRVVLNSIDKGIFNPVAVSMSKIPEEKRETIIRRLRGEYVRPWEGSRESFQEFVSEKARSFHLKAGADGNSTDPNKEDARTGWGNPVRRRASS